ncbi:MAG: tRNA (adenosine(37)-N6)-threonylcarbamoyltransferase complex transferase subunit TsaD [Sandaracinaceae bacterium]|nr:tRNA (adenosine(37)-N6)-threonylcarbamoyltransferase complex transferase subunit TsaD [Sandaracinaceae bacterium]
MRVLGIETSCDETGAAVVDDEGRVYSDVVASQFELHGPYGGVVPEIASRAHLERIGPVVARAVEEGGGLEAIDAVAVTQGPGLVGALLVGLSFGKALAWGRGLPFVGVDHLVAHLFAPFLQRKGLEKQAPELPFIALLASGGHTAIYEVWGIERIDLLGQTRDDAAGEAFDKAAKLLGLGYPGGPVIDRLAAQGDPLRFELPRPMMASLDFSFSGLKSALARHVEAHGVPEGKELCDLCASFQEAVVEVLVEKATRACRLRRMRRLVLVGGVAANRGLRAHAKRRAEALGIELFVPPPVSCTDNGAMVAYAGALLLKAGKSSGWDVAPYPRAPGTRRGKIRALALGGPKKSTLGGEGG